MTSDTLHADATVQHDRPQSRSLFLFAWRYLLYGGMALLPFMMWRFHPDVQFTFSDACLVGAMLFALFTGRLNISYFGGLTPLWIFSFVLMLGALGASSFINGDPLRFGITGSQYVFAYLMLPLVVLLQSPQEQLRVLMVFVASIVAIEAFSAAMFYIYGQAPLSLQWINDDFVTGAARLGSFFGSANRNAAVISLTVPFLLYFARTGIWPLWVTVPCLAVLGIALLLTASVTGLTSCLCAIALFVFAAYGIHAWKAVAVCAAVVALLWAAGFTLPAAFENRVLGAAETGDLSEAGSYTGRMELVNEAFELSDEVGILGIGSDQFRAVSDLEAPVHNVYLLIWTEGGPLALLGWLLAMGTFAWVGIRAFTVDRTTGALVLAVGISFLIISNASTHIYARMWVVPILFAVQAGVLCLQREKSRFQQHSLDEFRVTA